MNTNVTAKGTEIYANGGGILTQSYPTNFHQFWARKMLTAKESPDQFREVTATERAAIEKADAAYAAPSPELIDRWNAMGRLEAAIFSEEASLPTGRRAQFNVSTGYFEKNTITDITADQAAAIMELPLRYPYPSPLQRSKIRTNFVLTGQYGWLCIDSADRLFAQNSGLEVALVGDTFYPFCARSYTSTFGDCKALRKVLGHIDFWRITSEANVAGCFSGCSALQDVKILNLKVSISLAGCPLLTCASLKFLVDHANAASAKTVTVHSDVYAKLTDEGNEEWHAVMLAAADKNITFASA